MLKINNSFAEFLQDKNERQYMEWTGGYNFFLFKVPYDEDCDFIHVIRMYTSRLDPVGKPTLTCQSKLGGIYVYSLGLLFNVEYDLWDYMTSTDSAYTQSTRAPDVKEYYKRLKSAITAEIMGRIDAGQFDRAGAEKLVAADDRDILYYKEYRERGYAERDFLDGKRLDKPEIRVAYEVQSDCDIDAVLGYLRDPDEIIRARANAFMEAERVSIYKQLVCAEVHFESLREIEADKSNPLYYQREIRRVIGQADVKTVNITLERDGKSITVKIVTNRLGWNDYISDWDVAAPDRPAYKAMFGYKLGGDAKLYEITLITHGKKELYNKAQFEKSLSEDK